MIPTSSLNQSEVNTRVVINKLSVRLYLSTFLVISFVVPLTPSLSLSTTNTMACHDPEGWSAVSRLRSFDTTPCFEEGILLSSLLGGLLVISLVRSLSLAFLESSHVSSRSTWILRAKLVIIQSSVPNILSLINKKIQALLFGALFASTFNLVRILLTRVNVPVLASFVLEPVAIFSAISLTYYNHTRRRRSSTTLLLFWPLFALAVGIWIRTRVAIGLGLYLPIFIVKVIVVSLGLLSFTLECIGPEYGAEPQLGEKVHAESPVLTANIFSIWVSIFSNYSHSLLIASSPFVHRLSVG